MRKDWAYFIIHMPKIYGRLIWPLLLSDTKIGILKEPAIYLSKQSRRRPQIFPRKSFWRSRSTRSSTGRISAPWACTTRRWLRSLRTSDWKSTRSTSRKRANFIRSQKYGKCTRWRFCPMPRGHFQIANAKSCVWNLLTWREN